MVKDLMNDLERGDRTKEVIKIKLNSKKSPQSSFAELSDAQRVLMKQLMAKRSPLQLQTVTQAQPMTRQAQLTQPPFTPFGGLFGGK